MQTVWKLHLEPGINALAVPVGAAVLHFDFQMNNRDDKGPIALPTLWFTLDPEATPRCTRTFLVAETGEELPDVDARHIGTALTHDGRYVLHCFEVLHQ